MKLFSIMELPVVVRFLKKSRSMCGYGRIGASECINLFSQFGSRILCRCSQTLNAKREPVGISEIVMICVIEGILGMGYKWQLQLR
ncbi:hypothetical protein Ancab_028945 [Ancistrocladus abbreviatus]